MTPSGTVKCVRGVEERRETKDLHREDRGKLEPSPFAVEASQTPYPTFRV